MEYEEIKATDNDATALVKIRLEAMEKSLRAIGRYDPHRAKARFLDYFEADFTSKIVLDGDVIGFYVVRKQKDYILLDHFYIKPDFQGKGIGASILNSIKKYAKSEKLPIRLGALKNSRSNDFYKNNDIVQTHKSEWDNYYEFNPL